MKVSKIINGIFTTFFAVAILFVVMSLFPVTGNYKILVVKSGSMEPAIHTGAVVVTRPESEYRVGDIITFKNKGDAKNSITHRIVKAETVGGSAVYTTKGDANNADDTGKVPKSEVIGKVLFSVPYFGYAVDFAKKPLGFALLVIVPAGLIILEEVLKIINEIKNMKKEKKLKTMSDGDENGNGGEYEGEEDETEGEE